MTLQGANPSLSTAVLARMFPASARWSADPSGWVAERLGDHLWSRQRDIAGSVVDHRYTAVQSAHATGKSFLAARLVAWWLDTHPVGEAFAVTTAPTAAQISAILWRELRAAHERGGLAGVITQGQVPEWKVNGQLIGFGRSAPDHDATHLQGIHARYVLVVIDEACGVAAPLWAALDSLMTSEGSRALAIGNPDDPGSEFAAVCKPGSGWHVMKVSALDTPAFTGEEVPARLLEMLVGPRWVEERRARWGEDSPVFRSKVMGEFPELGDDTLIAPAWIRAAQERDLAGALVEREHVDAVDREGRPLSWTPERTVDDPGRFGCDVARGGSDETVVYRCFGGVIRLAVRADGSPAAWRRADTMRTTGEISQILAAAPGASAVVDATGVGAGVFDRLREQDLPVLAFNAANRARRPDRFLNRRAEVFWGLREAFREGRVDIDPADDELAAQLGAIRWRLNSRGLIQIESKDEMRARGLPSPDRADAAAMAFDEPLRVSWPDFDIGAGSSLTAGIKDELADLKRQLGPGGVMGATW